MPPYNAESWKKLIRSLTPKVKFGRPATEAQIVAVEQKLAVRFPDGLRELLREADGVTDRYGHGPIWSLAKIEKQNQEFRTTASFRELYMPFDHLLLFGADVDSDHFAFAIQADGHIHRNDVFRWEHETDARSWFAGNLEQFLGTQFKREIEADDLDS
ncbi:MAG: SMI1/KNR4 family protein [Fimbriimonadaceae bacterium]